MIIIIGYAFTNSFIDARALESEPRRTLPMIVLDGAFIAKNIPCNTHMRELRSAGAAIISECVYVCVCA